jgi:5-formyltetrahydrofolate cyclo-ligase
MLKSELRRLYREKREALTAQQRLKMDDLLLIQFQQLALPPLQHILSFYPIEEKHEVNTFHITDYLQFTNPGLQVAYPKTNFADNSMQAIIAEDEDSFAPNAYNIPEPVGGEVVAPEWMDAVLVPMLAFDVKGHRVGYGKGFYDRFLASCHPQCITIGLCYFDPVEAILDAGQFDVTLNYCITPHKVYVF